MAKKTGTDAAPAPATGNAGAFRIVVLQRGWVAVGTLFREGDEYRLEGAKIIRRWGTTKGLGQIAAGGPTTNTVLDEAGTLRFHVVSVVLMYNAEPSKWN
jgi:hypothetical protein